MLSDDRIAIWQLTNTILPLVACCVALSYSTQSFSLLSGVLSPLLFVLVVLFLSRSFSLMHDCGHLSLFRSKRANRIAAFALSIFHAMPHYPWSRGHDFHHKYNGNWDQYRGPSALTTVEKYQEKSGFSKACYRALRHPFLLFPGGFYYLVIKPRVTLFLGLIEFVIKGLGGRVVESMSGGSAGSHPFVPRYHSKFFYAKGEAYDALANTLVLFSAWYLIGRAIGYCHFFVLYFLVMSVSAALMIAVFFVQHNFPDSYASDEKNWSYFKGAIEGSSFLQLPRLLDWFTADIAYHHVHHLSERIPNYRLRDCHAANASKFRGVNRLYLSQVATCFSFILWDRERCKLVAVGDLD